MGDLIDGEEDFLVRWKELCSSGDIRVGGSDRGIERRDIDGVGADGDGRGCVLMTFVFGTRRL